MTTDMTEPYSRAADAVREADAIFIGAGAGMGVDSGLPDFRGDEGFWNAYPPFEQRNLNFYDLANPRWFEDDPELAWGFYGHRLHLYRKTQPHEGFELLLKWSEDKDLRPFIFTSNVDGQFQQAGFGSDSVVECHGSIHHMQCSRPCDRDIWDGHSLSVDVDEETFRAEPPLPDCEDCGSVARPNVLMFGDLQWISTRTDRQHNRMQNWLDEVDDRTLAVVECGAGTAVPTVRHRCERLAEAFDAPLIRINPREAHGPEPQTISIADGALDALRRIDELL